MYVCMHVCMYVCMYVCMHACMPVCMYVCMHVCMYACMHVCMYACMHVCMYAYMYVSNTYFSRILIISIMTRFVCYCCYYYLLSIIIIISFIVISRSSARPSQVHPCGKALDQGPPLSGPPPFRTSLPLGTPPPVTDVKGGGSKRTLPKGETIQQGGTKW